jgi:hypothetical protein
MLETFGMATGWKEDRRLVAAFERIFGATIFFGTDSASAPTQVVHRPRFNSVKFLREANLWYQRDGGEVGENVVTLSDEFFAEVTAHPIPTDLEAVRVLAAAPGALDLFLWLSYPCLTAKAKDTIPIFGSHGLGRQLLASNTAGRGGS